METFTDFDLFIQDPYLFIDLLDLTAPLPTDFYEGIPDMLTPPPSLSPATSSIASIDLYSATYLPSVSHESNNFLNYDPMITTTTTPPFDTTDNDPVAHRPSSPEFTLMPPLPKQRHYCNECPKSFGRTQELQRHITSLHEKTKRFVCSKCKKAFSRKDALRRHERNKNKN